MAEPGKKKDPLTLVELVSVVFLMAALIGIVPAAQGQLSRIQKEKNNLEICKRNLANLATALKAWAKDHEDRYPETLDKLVSDTYMPDRPPEPVEGSPAPKITPVPYISEIPTCPGATGQDKVVYRKGYRVTNRPPQFTVFCAGQNHEGLQKDKPSWNSLTGLEGATPEE
ncbi:MAG TPA: type II secretion system protein [Candidatus Nitrosotenuis sp.]|nr:type II secretion system protein [Candidatus Nitrosotenuis sp.]